MGPEYYTVEQMLGFIDEPNRKGCYLVLADYRNLVCEIEVFGKRRNWPGGYFDHLQETMNIAIVLFGRFNSIRPLEFSLSDLLLVVFLRGIERPRYYLLIQGDMYVDPIPEEVSREHFFLNSCSAYGLSLTDEHEAGVRSYGDCLALHCEISSLASLAHICDVASTHLWPTHPLEKGDPWDGARRVSSATEHSVV